MQKVVKIETWSPDGRHVTLLFILYHCHHHCRCYRLVGGIKCVGACGVGVGMLIVISITTYIAVIVTSNGTSSYISSVRIFVINSTIPMLTFTKFYK